MGQNRFAQIRRFFSMNATGADQQQAADTPWIYRVQAVAERLRSVCRSSYYPSSHVAIDEAVVPFKDGSHHTVNEVYIRCSSAGPVTS